MATAIARTIRLFADRALSPAALSARLVEMARAERDKLIAAGQASPAYRTIVDGREAATETGAQRAITYRFSRLVEAVGFALGYAIARSPVRSGRFRQSWFVAVDGQRWTADLTTIPPGVEVTITNDQPYSRKIDVGAMRMSVPPGIVEATRQAVQRAFPTVQAERAFVLLPGGYVLRGRGRSRRKDRAAGQPLTYPAVVLRERARVG